MSDGGPTLPGLLRRVAAEGPDRVAIAVDGGERLTYGEWERRSDALGRRLARTVDPGDRVALRFDAAGWTDYAVGYVGVLKAAAVAVPLSFALTDIEVRRILQDCEASALIAPPELAPGETPVSVFDPGGPEDQALGPLPIPSAPASALAEILYASGPLSRPSPWPRSGAALVARPSLRVDPGTAWLHAFQIGTLAGQDALRLSLDPAPLRSVVLPALDCDHLCALLAGGRIPACGLHPSGAQALLDSGATERHDVSGVRCLVLASGPVAPALLLRLGAAFPGASLLLADVLGHPPGVRTSFTYDRSRPGAIGRPVDGTAVWVAGEAGRPAEAGEVGRIRVGAAAAGEKRLEDGGEEAVAGDRLGYVDARGFLYAVSGEHDVVRRRGTTVLRIEVESALREHPAVIDAAVLGHPDDRSGPELAAAVVLDPPAPAPELQGLVRGRLGEDKTPERVFVVDQLPRDRSGALLRSVLCRRLGLSVRGGQPSAATESVQASDAVQATVAAAWARALRRDDFDPHDDFFEIGGDAFAAASVLRLVEDAFEVRVSPSAFFEDPTTAGLASAVTRLRRPRDAAPAPAPVAFSQEGMLWHELFAPGCQNLPGLARRYYGPLDLGGLRRALDEIVRRHGALRTGFELRDGRAVQVVRPHRELALAVRDLTGLAPGEQDAEVGRVVAEAGRRAFDLVADPLFEPTVLRLGGDDHVLVIRTHHSVFDDWSVGVFRRELAKLYAAYAAGEASPLGEPPLQFADFSRRQRSTLAGPAGTRQLSFWRRELAGAPLVTQLPVDDPDAPEGSAQAGGGPVLLALPPELGDRLRALARRERATVFMTVLAAFGILVHRYTGQDDLVLATVVANRNRTELEGLIGCFTKKLPLRLRLGGEVTFSEALARTRTALLGALSHQDLPFEAVVQDGLGAGAAAHGLVPHVALMFQGVTPTQELVLGDLETVGLQTASRSSRAHFMGAGERSPGDVPPLPWGAGLYAGTFVIVSLDESRAGLSCIARGAFHEPAVRQMMESFRTLLGDVAADPARPVSELALLDRQAGSEVLVRGLGPAEPPPAETLPGAFRAQVSRAPQAIAVRSRDRTLTYADLDGSSDRLAGRLRDLDVGPGGRVGIALEPSPELIVAAVAVWKAGAAWVALDPADAGERLGGIVREASLDVVVGNPGHSALAEHAQVVPANAEAGQAAAAETASAVPIVPPDAGGGRRGASSPPALRPGDPAVVFYGSGASAVDRGAVLDHRSVLNLLAGLRHDVHGWPGGATDERRVCLCPPATHDAFLRELAALLDGHALYIPERPVRDDPRQAVRLLETAEVNLVDCTADELGDLVEAGLRDSLRKRGRRAVEPVVLVGTRQGVAPELWRTLRSMRGIRAHVVYGPPECAFGATVRATAGASAPRGVGRPMAGVRSCVLGPHGLPLPPRAVGELYLGGASLAQGHLDPPAATADGRFVERRLDGASERLYRTGQLARSFPDGGVELLGPIDGGCDLRGFRVEPARIRAALAGCPGVRELAVALRSDGHGETRLVAYVVPEGRPPTLSELRTFLWTRLPGYAWPSALALVQRLPDGDGEDPPAHEGDRRDSATAEAEAEAEVSVESGVLGALWAEAVGVDAVAAQENYWQAFPFVEALARARDEGLHVPGQHVTRNRTIEALAASLEASRATSLEASRHPPEP